jgi:hypothetical protein
MSRKLLISIIISIVCPALAGLLETALHNVIWTDQWQAEPPARIWAALGSIDPSSGTGGFQ